MKILLIDSTYPINVRNKKILDSLHRVFGNEVKTFAIGWNRDNREIIETGETTYEIYNSKAQYGNQWSKLRKLIGYYNFIKKKNGEICPDILIASHWEVLFLCSLTKLKFQKLVYENLDIPTSASWLVLQVMNIAEKIALLRTDIIIFASRFFLDLYKNYNKPKFVLENLPFKNVIENKGVLNYSTDNLAVSFIGTVRYFDVMKLLIDAATDLPIEILFWGEGPDKERLMEYSKSNPLVKFFGKYEYENIGDIYNSSDVIWAVYPSADYNVKYAISNKFFESIVFKKPAIFASATKLGDYVKNNKLGFVVDPYNTTDIRNLLESFVQKQIYLDIVPNKADMLFWEENETVLKKIIADLNAN